MLNLKLQYFSHLMRRVDSLEKSGEKEVKKEECGLYGEGQRALPRSDRGCLEDAPGPSSLLCDLRDRPCPPAPLSPVPSLEMHPLET